MSPLQIHGVLSEGDDADADADADAERAETRETEWQMAKGCVERRDCDPDGRKNPVYI